ncbi:S9 family peptidase [Alicyclobacillus sp. SO9]|uniref:S9 family peptidase n=1 Tax=Alicyclobacillus sp. SO9 TaxID=2665646 RepID=UPI0018E6E602|nr:S9 family peptidase [Alicyclobacillus sp. SO9]QQE78238.1 S9 family peptidase [Alicyclobacillus sp. SO9]
MNNKRGVVDTDIFRLYHISEVTIDDSGKHVAFSVRRAVEQIDGYQTQIYVYDVESEELAPWTSSEYPSHSPQWSPDGRYLGFLSKRDENVQQFFVLPRCGGEARVLSDAAYDVASYQWSPDGKSVVLCAKVSQPVAGQQPSTESARVIDTIQYKFNGKGFTYNQQHHLLLLDVRTAEITPLTAGDADDTDPAWSPDGEWIAFVSRRHENRQFDLASDLFVVSPQKGIVRQLTRTQGAVKSPTWSPDGSWIAYVGTERIDSMPNHRHIHRVATSEGDPELLSPAFDRTTVSGSRLVWSAEGEKIWALFEDEGRVALLYSSINDGTIGGDRNTPSQITSFDISRSGLIAGVQSSPTRPPELYIGADSPSFEQVTHFHDDWCDEVQFSDMEAFVGESKDGTSVPCWMMLPQPFHEQERYPGVLKIHGGPYAQFGYGFNHELQLLCASGYAVFFANPRGSSGYSEEWARALGRNRGITDYEDLMGCTDAAIEQFEFVDSTRLIVTGGSYGGYMTSWAVGHTDRFCAACSEAAPNNLYSMSGSSDLAGSNHRLVYGFSAQEDPEFYMERSPISYTQSMTTPLLIIHSENDLRVSIEQGEQLFVALKLQRKEVKFVRFPGENHGLPRNGTPSHRLDRFHHILSWFADHLPIEGA